MKAIGLISEGSGRHNEDAAGIIEQNGEVIAAWVFDGVTGINDRNYLDAPTDAAWIVAKANDHLRNLAKQDMSLPEILQALVSELQQDWDRDSAGVSLPVDYDTPAACLLLAKRYADGWKVLRLGDSILLHEDQTVHHLEAPQNDLSGLEALLRREAKRLRDSGITDFKTLFKQFHSQHIASRRARNTPGNHSILVPNESSLAIPEYADLGWPESLLLSSDGFYRAVDTYGIFDAAGLMAVCKRTGGVEAVLRQIRAVEKDDPGCKKHLRFKPADDASAVMLRKPAV